MCACTPNIRTPYCGRGNCIPYPKPEGARVSPDGHLVGSGKVLLDIKDVRMLLGAIYLPDPISPEFKAMGIPDLYENHPMAILRVAQSTTAAMLRDGIKE
jgi:hypothetical protein